MIGIIVQLLISWLLVWLFEKNNLKVLGFFPTKKRLLHFLLFFIVTAILCSTGFLFKMYFAKQEWVINPKLSANLILTGVWWNIKSVLFEELIFRGVLFYILIQKLGSTKAIIISAIAFGIYHWFSFEVTGNPLQMAIVFLTTGIMGLLYAYGYSKTFSLYVPCAIHLGWNLTTSVVFSDTIIGEQLLVQVKPAPVVTVSYFVYYFMTFFPLVSTLLCDYFLLRRSKQVVPGR
ncbi:MAG: CPBP family intramembrane metalloprotease [Ferruginibacter sp.]